MVSSKVMIRGADVGGARRRTRHKDLEDLAQKTENLRSQLK